MTSKIVPSSESYELSRAGRGKRSIVELETLRNRVAESIHAAARCGVTSTTIKVSTLLPTTVKTIAGELEKHGYECSIYNDATDYPASIGISWQHEANRDAGPHSL